MCSSTRWKNNGRAGGRPRARECPRGRHRRASRWGRARRGGAPPTPASARISPSSDPPGPAVRSPSRVTVTTGYLPSSAAGPCCLKVTVLSRSFFGASSSRGICKVPSCLGKRWRSRPPARAIPQLTNMYGIAHAEQAAVGFVDREPDRDLLLVRHAQGQVARVGRAHRRDVDEVQEHLVADGSPLLLPVGRPARGSARTRRRGACGPRRGRTRTYETGARRPGCRQAISPPCSTNAGSRGIDVAADGGRTSVGRGGRVHREASRSTTRERPPAAVRGRRPSGRARPSSRSISSRLPGAPWPSDGAGRATTVPAARVRARRCRRRRRPPRRAPPRPARRSGSGSMSSSPRTRCSSAGGSRSSVLRGVPQRLLDRRERLCRPPVAR